MFLQALFCLRWQNRVKERFVFFETTLKWSTVPNDRYLSLVFFFSKGNQVACLVTHIWCSFDGWSQFLVVFLGDDDSSFLEREFFSVFQEHVDLTPKVRYLPCVQIWKKNRQWSGSLGLQLCSPTERACLYFLFFLCVCVCVQKNHFCFEKAFPVFWNF